MHLFTELVIVFKMIKMQFKSVLIRSGLSPGGATLKVVPGVQQPFTLYTIPQSSP